MLHSISMQGGGGNDQDPIKWLSAEVGRILRGSFVLPGLHEKLSLTGVGDAPL